MSGRGRTRKLASALGAARTLATKRIRFVGGGVLAFTLLVSKELSAAFVGGGALASIVTTTRDFVTAYVGGGAFTPGTVEHVETGNDSYTKLLLHFEGTNLSTTVIDSSAAARTVTAVGGACIATGNFKFGSACGFTPGGIGACFYVADSSDFTMGGGDFTVDFQCYRLRTTVNEFVFGQCNGAVDTSSVSLAGAFLGTDVFQAAVYVGATPYVVVGTSALSGGWHHIEFCRTGNILKLFINGVQEGGDVAVFGSVNDSGTVWSVGQLGEYAGEDFYGALDEFRISKGVARHTSNFTPPNARYGP